MSKKEHKNDVAKSFSQKGVFPPQYAFTLLFPLRNIFLSPKQLIKRLELKDAYMKEFYRMLKKDGILSVSEQAGDPDKMTMDELKQLADKHNFTVYAIFGKERNYTINFKK